MAEEISNRALAILLIVAIAISLGGTIVSLNRLSIVRVPIATGLASTDTGTATINITSTASLIFTTATVAFGNGWVNGSAGTFCRMTAEGGGTGIVSSECEDWTAGKAALVLENNGNVNVSVDIQVNATGTEFLGSGGIFEYAVNESEAGSCGITGSYLNASTNASDETWFSVTVADADTGVCENFETTGADTLYVHLRLNISSTSDMVGKGTSTAVITAEGTTV